MNKSALCLLAVLFLPLAIGAGCVPKAASPTSEQTSGSAFAIDAGIRVPDASNPLVVGQDGESVTLAYEYRSDELRDQPRERAYVASSEDGLSFADGRPWPSGQPIGPAGVSLPDGSVRRYVYDPAQDALTSATLDASGAYRPDDGIRYAPPGADSSDPNARTFGVSTVFVDPDGGVVLLYNGTNAAGDITVNRAYSEAGRDPPVKRSRRTATLHISGVGYPDIKTGFFFQKIGEPVAHASELFVSEGIFLFALYNQSA